MEQTDPNRLTLPVGKLKKEHEVPYLECHECEFINLIQNQSNYRANQKRKISTIISQP